MEEEKYVTIADGFGGVRIIQESMLQHAQDQARKNQELLRKHNFSEREIAKFAVSIVKDVE